MLKLDQSHTYTYNKKIIPGVTEILNSAGVINFNNVPVDKLENALMFGRAVHKICELYDRKDLDIADPKLHQYINAWKQFLKDSKFKIKGIEEQVMSKRFGYAGTLDRRGILYDRHCLIDIKSSYDFHPATALQTAAYQEAYNENNPKNKILDRYAVLLKPDASYKLIQYKNKSDFNMFVSCLNITNWKGENL